MPIAGWGGLVAVMVIRIYGRLPVLFWSQVRHFSDPALELVPINLLDFS